MTSSACDRVSGSRSMPAVWRSLGGELEHVPRSLERQLVALLDALESRSEQDGERQIGVRSRIRGPVLDTHAFGFASLRASGPEPELTGCSDPT